MIRVVLDTNVVVSAFLSSRGAPAQILEQWRLEVLEVVVSEPMLAEYQQALGYAHIRAHHHMSAEEIAEIIERFRQITVLVEPRDKLDVIERDAEDNKVLECAVARAAEFIVTGDADLLDLKEYQGIQILSPASFLALHSST